jgi:alpha-L-rhamnosidase
VQVDSLTFPGNANLIGMDDPTPMLRWTLLSATPGDAQTAYEIQVGTTEAGADVLATGKVTSTVQDIELTFPMLSATTYHLRVRVWDAANVASDWASIVFTTGLFSQFDWAGAQWIGGPDVDAAPLVRRTFTLPAAATRAFLFVAGAGYVDASVNGVPVSDTRVLEPGYTVYNKRVQYAAHDVTGLLNAGSNTLSAILGRGFYGVTTDTDWDWNTAPWHGAPRTMMVLLAETPAGDVRVVTDGSWETRASQITADSIYLGEIIDTRIDTSTGWTAATVWPAPAARVQAMRQPPIVRHAPIEPVSVTELTGGRYLYDFGIVTAGWVSATLTGTAGTDVRVVYGEKIKASTGEPNVDNPAVVGVMQTDHVILNGSAVEYEPRFSYKGFRYVLFEAPAQPSNVVAVPVYSDVPDMASFTSSNALLNQLWGMARQSQRINAHGIVSDTPTHEKIGWLGDTNVTAGSLLAASDAHPLLRKWLTDMADSTDAAGVLPFIVPSSGWYGYGRAPEWSSAFLLIAHRIWKLTGDRTVIGQHFPAMKRHIENTLGASTKTVWDSVFGDWSSPLGNGNEGGKDYSATLFVILQTEAFADMCDALGEPSSAYRSRAASLRAAYTARLFDGVDTFRPQATYTGDYRQGPNVLALAHGLVPEGKEAAVAARLVADLEARSNRLNLGIFSEEELLWTLTEQGYVDLAFAVTQVTVHPSWGQWATLGATTTWNGYGDIAAQRTLSHHMHSSYVAWFLGVLAGIRVLGPDEVLIDPHYPAALASCAATVRTPRGPVTVSWNATETTITIPPGLTATHAGVPLASGTHSLPR